MASNLFERPIASEPTSPKAPGGEVHEIASGFIRIAPGSLNETRHWLRRAYTRKLLDQEKVIALREIVNELAPRLNTYLRSMSKWKPDKA